MRLDTLTSLVCVFCGKISFFSESSVIGASSLGLDASGRRPHEDFFLSLSCVRVVGEVLLHVRALLIEVWSMRKIMIDLDGKHEHILW